MKTLQKSIFCLAGFSMFIFVSCQEKPKKETPKEEEEDSEMVKRPEGIITLDEAKILCTNYEDRRIIVIKDYERTQRTAEEVEEEFIPTQFINFELKTLKKYIKYVERKARKAKVKPDSLRIYLGNYGPDGKDKNKNTVFILPTAKVQGDYGGFFINTNGKAELIRNYWSSNKEPGTSQKAKASLLPAFNMLQVGGGSLILNDGHSGPPPSTDF